jgi:hypothetical protein
MTLTTIGQGRRDKETGEPDDATSVTSGSEGGWEKRPEVDLARSLPNCTWLRWSLGGPLDGASPL